MTWVVTDLSVSPPNYPMADTDRETFRFNAGETITAATASLTELGTMANANARIEGTLAGATYADVIVSGLTRGSAYELAVTFTNSLQRMWTRTLVLECVA